MNVNDFTYSELNKRFSELINLHRGDTEFFSQESAKKYADDDLISGDYLPVQNAFDELCTEVDGLKEVFDWSCGIDVNDYDVGLKHINDDCQFEIFKTQKGYHRNGMIYAECKRRNVDILSVIEYFRIVEEMECVNI